MERYFEHGPGTFLPGTPEGTATREQWVKDNIRVYQVTEEMWIAADSPEGAQIFYLDTLKLDEELLDEFGDPVLLTPEEMRTRIFTLENGDKLTFQEVFDSWLGADFPAIFAEEL